MKMTKQKIKMSNFALKEKRTQLNEKFAKIFQKEIDWVILSDILVKRGWTKVEISLDRIHIVEKWVEDNIQGKYDYRHAYGHATWLFENEKDATMFILRWS